jgi:general secretion pathway protein L
MKDATSTIGYRVGRPIIEVWDWWKAELAATLPLSFRQILFNVKKLVLEINGDDVEIYRVVGSKRHTIGILPLIDLTSHQNGKVIREPSATERILCLPQSLVLEKNIAFPMATEENLREVLSYEMDRLTPFSAEQVYYDYIILSRDKKKNTIELKLFVVPRDRVSPLINKLQSTGFQPHVVTVKNLETGGYFPMNLLPSEKRAKRMNALRVVNLSLGVVVILLFIASVIFPIWIKTQSIKVLEPEIEAYTEKAAETTKLREQVAIAKEEALFLGEKKSKTILTLEVLDELTQIIPDDTWISQLEIEKNIVNIHGESISSAVLLPIIESSKLFNNAQFRSPVTQNRRSNTERFHLSANIKQEES